MAFKLAMTSILAFLPASLQLQFGMAFCGIFMIILLVRPPYKRKGDLRLHMVAVCELLLMCIAGQTIIVQGTYLQPSVDIALSALFIGICVFMFVIFVYIAAKNLLKLMRTIDWSMVWSSLRTCTCRDCLTGRRSGASLKLKSSSQSTLSTSNNKMGTDDEEFGDNNNDRRDSNVSNSDALEMTTINGGVDNKVGGNDDNNNIDRSLMAASRRDRARERNDNELGPSSSPTLDNRHSSGSVAVEKKGGMLMRMNPLFVAAHVDPFGQPTLVRATSGNDTLARALARQPSAGTLDILPTTTTTSGTGAPQPEPLTLKNTDSSDDGDRIIM
jgi:hypothetical protein